MCVHYREQELSISLALICRSKQPMARSFIVLWNSCTQKIQCAQPELGVAVTIASQRFPPKFSLLKAASIKYTKATHIFVGWVKVCTRH